MFHGIQQLGYHMYLQSCLETKQAYLLHSQHLNPIAPGIMLFTLHGDSVCEHSGLKN